MKNLKSKFLCLSLLQVACSNCMEHKQGYNFTWVDNTTQALQNLKTLKALDQKNQVHDCSQTQDESFEEVDILKTSKFRDKKRKAINAKIKFIKSTNNLNAAQDMKSLMEKRKSESLVSLNTSDSLWLGLKITELETFINEANSNKHEATVCSHTAILVEMPETTESSKFEKAELIDLKKQEEESLSTRASQDEIVPVTDLNLEVQESINNITEKLQNLSPIKIAPQFASATDLTKSIQEVTDLDKETQEKLDQLDLAQKEIKSASDDKRVEAAKNLLAGLEATEIKKKEAIRTLETELKKLEDKSKEDKNLEPQVKDLRDKINSLKNNQKQEEAQIAQVKNSSWFSWFIPGWFSKKQIEITK